MSNGEGFYSNIYPLFDGVNYAFWRLRMITYLSTLGFDIWDSVKSGYTIPSTPSINSIDKKLFENYYKAQNAIMSGLVDSELVKVMGWTTTK